MLISPMRANQCYCCFFYYGDLVFLLEGVGFCLGVVCVCDGKVEVGVEEAVGSRLVPYWFHIGLLFCLYLGSVLFCFVLFCYCFDVSETEVCRWL